MKVFYYLNGNPKDRKRTAAGFGRLSPLGLASWSLVTDHGVLSLIELSPTKGRFVEGFRAFPKGHEIYKNRKAKIKADEKVKETRYLLASGQLEEKRDFWEEDFRNWEEEAEKLETEIAILEEKYFQNVARLD